MEGSSAAVFDFKAIKERAKEVGRCPLSEHLSRPAPSLPVPVPVDSTPTSTPTAIKVIA
jgi:hypothetical protein